MANAFILLMIVNQDKSPCPEYHYHLSKPYFDKLSKQDFPDFGMYRDFYTLLYPGSSLLKKSEPVFDL
jgi:hypothetical protein